MGISDEIYVIDFDALVLGLNAMFGWWASYFIMKITIVGVQYLESILSVFFNLPVAFLLMDILLQQQSSLIAMELVYIRFIFQITDIP